jgi:hypothetical protein
MGKKSFKKHQKLYKMKGCSTKKSRRRLGGGGSSSQYLAYTGEPIAKHPNPFLAYTGKGGSNYANNISLPPNVDVRNPNLNYNPYGANPALPNTGPVNIGKMTTPTNMGLGSNNYGGSRGGSCGTCTQNMTGGSCGCDLFSGGKNKQKGGKTIDPQGLVGSPWTASPATWPGVDGVDGNRNYLAYNNYKIDPQTALISVGANPPFLFGGRNKGRNGGRKKRLTKRRQRRQRGGALSNFIGQDFINLGRQIQYGIGSAYNGINGYPAPTPVLPWQGQLPRTPNLYTIRGAAL